MSPCDRLVPLSLVNDIVHLQPPKLLDPPASRLRHFYYPFVGLRCPSSLCPPSLCLAFFPSARESHPAFSVLDTTWQLSPPLNALPLMAVAISPLFFADLVSPPTLLLLRRKYDLSNFSVVRNLKVSLVPAFPSSVFRSGLPSCSKVVFSTLVRFITSLEVSLRLRRPHYPPALIRRAVFSRQFSPSPQPFPRYDGPHAFISCLLNFASPSFLYEF